MEQVKGVVLWANPDRHPLAGTTNTNERPNYDRDVHESTANWQLGAEQCCWGAAGSRAG